MTAIPVALRHFFRMGLAGLLISLPSDGRPVPPGGSSGSALMRRMAGLDVVQLSETEWRVPLAQLGHQDLVQFVIAMEQDVVPLYADDRFVGYRIEGVDRCPLFKKIGFREGDIVRLVNGEPLQGIFAMMARFRCLQPSVTIERGGQLITFRYRFE